MACRVGALCLRQGGASGQSRGERQDWARLAERTPWHKAHRGHVARRWRNCRTFRVTPSSWRRRRHWLLVVDLNCLGQRRRRRRCETHPSFLAHSEARPWPRRRLYRCPWGGEAFLLRRLSCIVQCGRKFIPCAGTGRRFVYRAPLLLNATCPSQGGGRSFGTEGGLCIGSRHLYFGSHGSKCGAQLECPSLVDAHGALERRGGPSADVHPVVVLVGLVVGGTGNAAVLGIFALCSVKLLQVLDRNLVRITGLGWCGCRLYQLLSSSLETGGRLRRASAR